LILAYFSSRCGCTVAQLKKRDYAPGESGTIKAAYSAPRVATTAQKYIYVSSNDKANPRIRLVIKAKVVQIVQATPAKLALSLRAKNLGLTEITIQTLDNNPFSIKTFASTPNQISLHPPKN